EVIDVAGIEDETLQLCTLFKYEYEGDNADGSLRGRFDAKPLSPSFLPRLRYFGMASSFLEALGVAKVAEV
ncbi:MAG: CpaF family protein, partial [Rhodomicrobium sp.]